MIHHIVSLGTFCHMASHLQRYNMRKCSYPFDWILSSPKMVMECLRDDFKTFLDPKYHRSMGDGTSNHVVYGSMVHGNNFHGTPTLNHTFTHKDITDPATHASYVRAVERFRAVLSSPDPKLFVLCTQDVVFDRTEIEKLQSLLDQMTTNAQILCISLHNDYTTHYSVEHDGKVKYVKMYTYSRSDGRGFAKPDENDRFQDILTSLYSSA